MTLAPTSSDSEPSPVAAASTPRQGAVLWEPSATLRARCRLTAYLEWLSAERGLSFGSYDELWRWSVGDLEGFWGSVWGYFEVRGHAPPRAVLGARAMPGARFFDGATLSYAEHALRRDDDGLAIVHRGERGERRTLTFHEVRQGVARVRAGLARLGVGAGDRVAAFLPNAPEAVLAMLATASLGAVWSSCSPEFGVASVLDRFGQIEPKVLLVVDGYCHGGKVFDRRQAVAELRARLPSLVATVEVARLAALGGATTDAVATSSGGTGGAAGSAAAGSAGVGSAGVGSAGVGSAGVGSAGVGSAGVGSAGVGSAGVGSVATSNGGRGGAPAATLAGSQRVGSAVLSWDALVAEDAPLAFEPVPFDHPLWILYSSGTTGLPKPIVQGHGGILLEHLKSLALHCDLGAGDRFFWFTTTGWMMWNFLVGGLLVGATIHTYEGSPGYPDLESLWRLAAEERLTYFGTSAPFLVACRKAGLEPRAHHDLRALRSVGSTGSPLPVEGFEWVYRSVGEHLLLGSISGGTDVCTAFVTSCPLLPVRAGELQCRALGAKVEAFDELGRSVVGQVGELVITEPMPSMPLCFWNDPDGARLHESYFDVFPGVWRHGDWIELTESGGAVIYGRSDSTLNRAGVRMGTSEVYRVVEQLAEVADSLIIDTGTLGREGELWLFVVLSEGVHLDGALQARIRAALRSELSPRHVPDRIVAISEVPRTLSGKKLEVPIKKLLMGAAPESCIHPGTLANPRAVDELLRAAR